jgi:hypothetical protein
VGRPSIASWKAPRNYLERAPSNGFGGARQACHERLDPGKALIISAAASSAGGDLLCPAGPPLVLESAGNTSSTGAWHSSRAVLAAGSASVTLNAKVLMVITLPQRVTLDSLSAACFSRRAHSLTFSWTLPLVGSSQP